MYARFLEIKKQMEQLDKELDSIKCEIFNKAVFDGKSSTTINDGEYKIRIQQKESVTVDQGKAELFSHLFKKKFEFSKTMFDKFSNSDKDSVNSCITTKPAKPNFVIERIGGE